MGRTSRSSVMDKENTPRSNVKTRLRSSKTPVPMVNTPRKALGDLNKNLASTRELTPMMKKKPTKAKPAAEKEKTVEPATVQQQQQQEFLPSASAKSQHKVAPPVSSTTAVAAAAAAAPACSSAGVSSRPPCYRHLSNEQWETLQLTAGPDDLVFWWRAAEERREALSELIGENVSVHQQNKELRQELVRLQGKESEASYFSLMARLWELESAARSP